MVSSRSLLWPAMVLLAAGCVTPGGTPPQQPAEVTQPREVMSESQREALQPALDLMHAGEWQTARELLQELLVSEPTLALVHANMGSVQWQLGETQRAEQAWLKAVQLRPDWAALYNRLGIFYRDEGRFSEALAMYQQALRADDGYAYGHRNIAILYEFYLGDEDQAVHHYRRYQQLLGDGEHEVRLWIADLEQRRAGGK